MPDYPKTTGELVTDKDSKDGQAKLLDTLIQLLRQADAETLQSLNELAQTVSDLSGKAWKNNQSNLPATNNTYDIGSLSQMIKHIYSMGMTLGVEGEDWEINDNDGYARLVNGLLIHWGYADYSNGPAHWIPFSPSYQKIPSVIVGRGDVSNQEWCPAANPPVSNKVSKSGFYLNTIEWGRRHFWIAVGY